MLGAQAEQLICDQLQGQNWQILARNFRAIGCEIDIVARKAETIIFVEVKARSKSSLKFMADYQTLLNFPKQQALRRGALKFLSQRKPAYKTARIDLAVVFHDKEKRTAVEAVRYFANVINL